jgi:uncharacterized protein (TIGR04376 family)
MGVFEDLSRFLEERLDEFLRSNPHLELQALDEQLIEQEEAALQLVADLKRKEKHLESQILETAREIQLWHGRVEKARSKNRPDLAAASQEREAALLRQGNQLWGQMTGCKERIQQTQSLYQQIQVRRKEVGDRIATARAQQTASTTNSTWSVPGWSAAADPDSLDPLEQQFARWDLEDELETLKQQQGPR